jgi:hypothetical protein
MTKMMRRLMVVALMLLAVAAVRPVQVKAMPRPARIYGWTNCDMCLRSYPGGNIVTVVPKGAEVVVISTDDCSQNGFYWARVQYSGVDAYMAYTNEAQNVTFLEFQKWDYVEGTSGWVRLLREVTFSSGPNPELSGTAQLEPGRELYVQAEMSPVKYGSNICRVWVDGIEGYINANVSQVNPETYEYIGISDFYSYVPATTPTQSQQPINERGIAKMAMNLRQYATTNSEPLRVLEPYEAVWVESLETTVSGDKWYRVNTGAMEGYVAEFGITVGQTLDRYANTITAVNLRTAPTTNSPIIVTIPNSYKIWAVTRFNGVGNSQTPNWVHVSARINGVKIDGFVVDWAITH